MLLDAAVVGATKLAVRAMASGSLKAAMSLDVMADEGRQVQLGRQGSLSSPKVNWRATSPRVGGSSVRQGGGGGATTTLRRAQSVGSALSEFLGGSSSARKSLEENNAMRRSGSKGCLESLEAAASYNSGIPGDDMWERLEEDREWNFATLDNSRTLRPGGMLHRDTFPSPQFLSQEPWQSVGNSSNKLSGKESFPRPRTQLKRSASTGHKLAQAKKSIVFEQAQESFDSLKDRLESSLKMQPECSYQAPPSSISVPGMASVMVQPNLSSSSCQGGDVGVLGFAEGVGGLKLSALPRSLQRRKNKERNARSSAMSNAFSALVFILKSMHGHALEMQEEHVVRPMLRDMDLSFAWLFQQVFATTPEYMLSIMVLLAEFTVHSLGEDMALASALALTKNSLKKTASRPTKDGVVSSLFTTNQPIRRTEPVSKHHDDTRRESTILDKVLASGEVSSLSGKMKMPAEDETIMHALMVEAMEKMEANSGWEPPPVVDKEAMKQLVAPVHVTVSLDNYSCFDRTELEYQHAIGSQPTNVMLLSNYAQFLYVVRHDHNRAEEYFHRAIRADPSDGEVLGRFATFLWLGRGDKETAERAFRAAAALDPTNPYHAGNYSHFLWHSEDSKYPKCSATCYVGSE